MIMWNATITLAFCCIMAVLVVLAVVLVCVVRRYKRLKRLSLVDDMELRSVNGASATATTTTTTANNNVAAVAVEAEAGVGAVRRGSLGDGDESLFSERRSVMSFRSGHGRAPPRPPREEATASVERETHPDLWRLNSLSSQQSFRSLHGPASPAGTVARDLSKPLPLPYETVRRSDTGSHVSLVDIGLQVTSRAAPLSSLLRSSPQPPPLSAAAAAAAAATTDVAMAPGSSSPQEPYARLDVEVSAADRDNRALPSLDGTPHAATSPMVAVVNNNNRGESEQACPKPAIITDVEPAGTPPSLPPRQRNVVAVRSQSDASTSSGFGSAGSPGVRFDNGEESSNPLYSLSRGPSEIRGRERASNGVEIVEAVAEATQSTAASMSAKRSINPKYTEVQV